MGVRAEPLAQVVVSGPSALHPFLALEFYGDWGSKWTDVSPETI